MEEIFQFIFSNIIFILVIIGGLISMFRNRTNNEQENKRPSPIPKTADNSNRKREEIQNPFENKELSNKDIPKNVQETITTVSHEEKRKEQLERLKEKVESIQSFNTNEITENPIEYNQQTNISRKQKKKVKKKSLPDHIKNNLTRDGLAQSIVMMEILGPPRAIKQHSYNNLKR